MLFFLLACTRKVTGSCSCSRIMEIVRDISVNSDGKGRIGLNGKEHKLTWDRTHEAAETTSSRTEPLIRVFLD